jgi:pyruvate/2-oxoglutarate dehydrogenase complex dihydrolipoamide dehydrogenase (E3) component
MLVVAAGRVPNVEGLDLDQAGVEYSDRGIRVDDRLRTNVRHIYAAGDVVGGPQFTHLAAWQAFQAVRNALLPGSSSGSAELVPWVTFTDPEVAHVGLTEEDAKKSIGDQAHSHFRPMKRVDRAVSDGTKAGFVKLVTGRDNVLLGATVVASRAGELLGELTLAIQKKLSLKDLAGIIHAYPTYSTAIQQLSAEASVAHLLDGTSGKVVRTLSKLLR